MGAVISILLASMLAAYEPLLASNDAPAPTPTGTPFPEQDPPEDVAKNVPPSPLPSPTPQVGPKKEQKFVGDYAWLPLTMDVGWRPCLNPCGNVPYLDRRSYARDGEVSLWAGYAFQPIEAKNSPFMAGGVEWVLAQNDPDWNVRGRHLVIPTWRMGMQFSGITSIYATAGVVLPVGYAKGVGWHAGIGATSPLVLLLSTCLTGAAVPSVAEFAWESFPLERGAPPTTRTVVKLGWGF